MVQSREVGSPRSVGRGAPDRARRWAAPVFAGSLLLVYALVLALIQTDVVSARPLTFVDIALTASFVGWGLLGALILSRRPEHVEGWLLAAAGTVTVVALTCQAFGDGASPEFVPRFLGWLETWVAEAGVPVLVVLLIVYFPQGRLRTGLERATAYITIAMGLLTAAAIALAPGRMYGHDFVNPFGIAGFEGVAEVIRVVLVDGPLLAVAFLLAVVSLVIRTRRSRGVERQQIKWFIYSVVTVALLVIPGSLASTLGLTPETTEAIILLFSIAIGAVPAAITVALLRYRLYDIDVLINRTLVYVTLTTILAGTYAACVVIFQAALRPVARGSDLVVAAATLAVAALFQPIRRRVQAFIDRLFYRRKYDSALVISDFSARIRDEVELGAISRQLEAVVRDAMQPASVSVWTVPVTPMRFRE